MLVSAVVFVLRLVIILAVANVYVGVGVNVRMGDEALTSGGAGGTAGGGSGDEGIVTVESE